ncbi:MAG: hypothetical protein A3G20_02970 [Acidobacteria bacterium RIFCSPLOWO2_12_FULL_59_11]|nr:MAG: hypothetical protein A3G20_02970 [Acidobacteria bacterium RIFCSPLOWO2_12_FULL_59_11]
MTARMFRKTQLNRSRKFLCGFVAIAVHIPATLNKPVLNLIERYFSAKVAGKRFTDLVFSNHFAHILSHHVETDYTF